MMNVWRVESRVRGELHVVNLLRKVFMSDLGVLKLQVDVFESSDPFIVREFIESRIKQIPIN